MIRRPLFYRILRLFGLGLLISFACCLTVSAGFVIHTGWFIQNSTRTEGRIIALTPMIDSENQTTNYAPIFRFTANNGQTYTITASVASNPPGFDVGDPIKILYPKNEPENARIDSFGQLWFIPMVIAGIGLTHGLIAAAFLGLVRRRDKRVGVSASLQAQTAG